MRRGSSGRRQPSVTGAMLTRTWSSSPASWNWPTRSPPPTSQTLRSAGGLDHLGVHGGDVALHEPEVDAGDRRELAVREDPARPVGVERLPALGMLEQLLVVEHPLVGRGAHRHGADVVEERGEPGALVLPLDGEEPVQRVVARRR